MGGTGDIAGLFQNFPGQVVPALIPLLAWAPAPSTPSAFRPLHNIEQRNFVYLLQWLHV